MTDRIDLDDVETEDPDEETERPNPGDWFWRGEGDPADETFPAGSDEADVPVGPDAADASAGTADAGAGTNDASGRERTSDPVPHVPRETKDRPVGIPKASGGAGAGPGPGEATGGEATAADDVEGDTEGDRASGPHGGDADDLTLALTYRAARRLADPAYAFADAAGWSDWLGVVGDVPAHAITKFQREHGIDADFFNGTEMGPRERLADVDERSMFFAERFVLVGCEGEAEWAPEAWEFLPVERAAAKADWELK